MTLLRILLLLLASVGVTPSLQAQPAVELARAAALWEAKDFRGAYQALFAFRRGDFGRSFEVDFMLGTSACRIPEVRPNGAAYLEWTLRAYADRLTPQGFEIIVRELANCRMSSPPPDAAPVPQLQQVATAGGRYQGKTFYWLDTDSRNALGSHLTTGVVPVPLQVLAARQIRLGDRAGAERVARSAVPNGVTRVFARFVVTSDARHTATQLADANRILERYLDFFVRTYGMRSPDRYIFVYLTPSIDGLSRLASRHHGLSMNFGAIAYSLRDDLSIAAVIPTTSFGSLFHELFHLMARSNFGDIPGWLDEGIASLYEVSQARADGFVGVGNWRGKVLARFREHIPSLKVLIENSRPMRLDASTARNRDLDEGMVREAIFSATGRYFALYLQEKGKLADVYAAIRDYSTSGDFDGREGGVFLRIETITGMKLKDLDVDFRSWLARQEIDLLTIQVDQALDKYIPPRPF
jgi:hypothetical protein